MSVGHFIFRQNNSEDALVSSVQNESDQQILTLLSHLSYRSGELDSYLDKIAKSVSQLLDSDWSIVTVCQNEVGQVVASSLGLSQGDNGFSLHGTLVAEVIQSGRSRIVEDARLEINCAKPPAEYLGYLGVPLRTAQGNCIGTVCSFFHQPHSFSAGSIQLVEIFAERAATAIDNYQLYQQQQQFNQALEAEVAQRTQELRQTQRQLLKVNEQLEQRVERRTVELRQANEQLQAEIRERQQIEAALRQSEIRFRTLVENAADAFLLIDPANSKILDANRQACENLGYSYEELLTLSIQNLDVKVTAEQLAEFHQHLVIGIPSRLESEHRRKDGTTFPIEANVCLFEAEGRLLQLALVRDISDRKLAEQAMARLAEVGELAAMIVHEVRNPLTTILMALTALRGISLPEKMQMRLALGLEDAERLQRLLNEILLYAKTQVVQSSELELNALIAGFLEFIQETPVAKERNIQLVSSLPAAWVLGDRDKLKQVFINLIKNACEAIEAGETITCRLEPVTQSITEPITETNQICISIHNGGTAIAPEVLTKLGTPFFTTKLSGNGLGLAIVHRIIRAHHGKLQIQSDAKTGTTVSILLPLIRHKLQ
jgi:PAS domain S-box-containing protein